MKRISFLLLLSLFITYSNGQNTHLPKGISNPETHEAGKPKIINPYGKTPWPYNHFVDCGIHDKLGNLWFGTSDGVYRYDGKLFTNYQVMEGLRMGRVSKMLEDRAGNIWFGAIGGIVRFDPSGSSKQAAPSFSSIKIPLKIPSNTSPDIVTGLNGNLNGMEATDAAAQSVTQIIEDKRGAIWFCAGYNVYRSDGKSAEATATSIGNFFKSEKVQMSCGLPDDFGIVGIYEDKQGNILISLVSCCCCYNVTYCLNESRTSNPCILNSCKHDPHNQQDMAAHNKEIAASLTKITREDGNTNMAFTTTLNDKSGKTWFGGSEDGGVYFYNGKHFIPFAKNDALSKSIVTTIFEDKNGNIWFGTGDKNSAHGNGVFRYDPSALPGTSAVTHFTAKDGLCNTGAFKNDIISSIAEDNTGKLWFAGDGGISCYNGKSFTSFSQKDDVNEQPINCIVKDNGSNLWFGTWDLGLYRYDGKLFVNYTENASPKG